MNRIGFIGATIVILLAILNSTMFVVDQRQFGVVNQFGEVQRVITQPGLYFKFPPPFQNVTYLDKRLLTLESRDIEPLLTAEKQRIVIEWFVRWHITDPLEYIRNVGLDSDAGAQQLDRVMRNAVQDEINRRTVGEIIARQRDSLMADVKSDVTKAINGSKPWGIEVVDVRITRADYVASITESVYKRMQAERQRVANELRSTGVADGEKIRADADRQREVIVADAYRAAQEVRGKGDAQANQIYADAFNQDPQFAEFYRSLGAYKESIGKKGDFLVVDPASSQFFNDFRKGFTPAPAR
ncbi:MAG: protease modulator HflC [Burkholderiaceae bacterium]|jgi:membrane protease subunit HflC|nr:MAG: protease modulator HflC [Burkholderiaceae bacterium]